jgi:amidase
MPLSRPISHAGEPDVGDLFATHDALAVADLVRKRRLGARELLDCTLEKLRGLNASLNAITDLYEGELLERSVALAGGGPFQGVPYLIKQLMADCAGTPTTLGSRFFANQPVASSDSAAVARMRRAGLVIVGRTNTSELGLAPTTEPAFGGATRNPWRHDLSPGGSSGGSAAVVAARGLPMAHATDGGGSIRIPAALCGVFGLKPSRGRVSLAPIGETLAGAGAQHCVSISVRDSAALLDAMAGSEPGDPYAAPPAGSFLAATQQPPGRLRVAFMIRQVGGEPLDPVLVAAVQQTAKLLDELGHDVDEAAPDYDAAAMGTAFGTVMCANTFSNIQVRANGRVPRPDDLEPVTRLYAEIGKTVSAHDYIRAVQTFHRTGRQLGRFLERYDVLLSPTIARTHLPLGEVRMDGSLEQYQASLSPMVAFTSVCNVAGVPAMSLPIAWTGDGLPLGMHFVARFGAEELLYSLAAELERANPWRERRP